MAFAERFEDLEIWQQSQELAVGIYRAFGPQSSAAGDFRFIDQIRSAAVSISNNIAEGFDSGSNLEFARFLRFAKRSSAEVRSMLYLAEKFNYLDGPAAKAHRESAEIVSKRISAFIKSLK